MLMMLICACAICYRWGRIAARYPLFVILSCVVICGALMFGIYFAEVVTDPVQLWSGPQSRTRLNKNYFDNTFA